MLLASHGRLERWDPRTGKRIWMFEWLSGTNLEVAPNGAWVVQYSSRAATAELTKSLRRAEPRLELALKKPASLEASVRIQRLLEMAVKPDAEERRVARAIESLQVLGSTEAVQLLAEWASSKDDLIRREVDVAISIQKR